MIRSAWVILSAMILAEILRAEPTPPAQIDPQSSHVFRSLLRNRGLEPTIPGDSGSDWSDTVLIVFGPIVNESQQAHVRQLSSWVISRGGALLIASDGKLDFGDFPPSILGNLEIDGRMLEDTEHCFDGMSDLPLVRFRSTVLEVDLKQISLLNTVVTNRPSFLSNYRPELIPFGEFSTAARVGSQLPASRVGIAIMPPDRGVCMVISDAGILANQLLVPQGVNRTENYQFAYHLVSYLVNGPNRTRNRTRCVFIEGGKYLSHFDDVQFSAEPPEFRPPWAAIQKTLAENAERKIDEIQDRDLATRNLLRRFGFLSIVQKLIATAAIFAILIMLRSIWTGRVSEKYQPDTPIKTVASEQASRWSLAAREKLLRQFMAWGVSQPPQLAVHGSRLYRKRMENLLKPLIDVAFGPGQPMVNAQTWRSLDATITKIDQEIRRGSLQFVECGS